MAWIKDVFFYFAILILIMKKILKYIFPALFFITATFFTIYIIGQQMLRQGANDPQIQLSEDVALALATGKGVQDFLPPQVDISESIAPFVIVYDANGVVISSTATLYGITPEIPLGVLDYAKHVKQNRVTWEPQPGIREAAVVTYFNGQNEGYVVSGRSLREIERREDSLLKSLGLLWLFTLVGTGFMCVIGKKKFDKK